MTTLDAAASSVTFSKSNSDATTVLTPRVFNTFALSAFLTRAVISSASLLGWLSRRWSTDPPTKPDYRPMYVSVSELVSSKHSGVPVAPVKKIWVLGAIEEQNLMGGSSHVPCS